ncbi:MAG: hypothetical protein IPJ13_27755 [Saprospiraceae bacterium]|jgi:hypothetical protein|nr:hypothetical protein [Saprospiraceae bacterium]MBK9568348.1 hypothetical protein [Saprospiraceae bacterium]
MPIVTNIEIADTLGLTKFGPLGTSLRNGLMHMLSISDLNKIYDTYSYLLKPDIFPHTSCNICAILST